MSELFSAEVHAGVGVVWGQSRPWTPALCVSSFLAITTRRLPSISQTYAWELKIRRSCLFPLVDPRPPLQVIRTSVWRAGRDAISPALNPLLSRPPPTRVQSEKTRHPVATAIEDKEEKSNHIEKVFRTLCWFWGSVGKKRWPGRAPSSAARREDGSSPGGCRPATVLLMMNTNYWCFLW